MSKKKSTMKRQPLKKVSSSYTAPRIVEGWSARRVAVATTDKIRMARHFAMHDLFVQEDRRAADRRKITAVEIVVNPGTTPNEVVKHALESVKIDVENNPNHAAGPHIRWYTPGSLVLATVRDFRVAHPYLRTSCELHMFPGDVDPDLEMVRGEQAILYAQRLDKCFTYALLSAYAFDMNTGTAFFFFEDELKLQQAIALREAEHKFLFLDPDKLKRAGSEAYTIRDLLQTSRFVTIYTVSSKKDSVIRNQFCDLANRLLNTNNKTGPYLRRLRLVIVNKEKQINIPVEGELRTEHRDKTGTSADK